MTAADDLRLLGVVNSHDLCRWATRNGYDKSAVFVAYRPQDKWTLAGWQVIRPGYQTDPGGHWSNFGDKTFDGTGSEVRDAALAWASERYGVTEWKGMTGLGSDRFPADLVALAKAAIRDAKRSARTEARR